MRMSSAEVKKHVFLKIPDVTKKKTCLEKILQCQFDLYVNQSNKDGASPGLEQR
jgi:hypothetical protein